MIRYQSENCNGHKRSENCFGLLGLRIDKEVSLRIDKEICGNDICRRFNKDSEWSENFQGY